MARKSKDEIRIPFKIYYVYTHVKVILSIVSCFLLPLTIFLIFMNGPSYPSKHIAIIRLIIIHPLILFFSLMCAYMERKYVQSINRSAATAFSNEGAKEFSILCFISSGLSFILYIGFSFFNGSTVYDIYILIVLPTATLNSFSTFMMGLVAMNYANTIQHEYIDDLTEETKTNKNLTFPDTKNDTSEASDIKYIQEVDLNTNYEEKFYE